MKHKFFIYEVNKKIAKQSNRSLGEAKTRFISPLGEIFIDAVNKGLRSNQTAVSANEVKLKQGLFAQSATH